MPTMLFWAKDVKSRLLVERRELENLRLKKILGFSNEILYWFNKNKGGYIIWRHVGPANGAASKAPFAPYKSGSE